MIKLMIKLILKCPAFMEFKKIEFKKKLYF